MNLQWYKEYFGATHYKVNNSIDMRFYRQTTDVLNDGETWTHWQYLSDSHMLWLNSGIKAEAISQLRIIQ